MENWNSQFREIKYPSVELFLTTEDVENIQLNVAVCRSVDEYPKYVIHFERYLSFRSNEEAGYEFDFQLPENSFLTTNSIVLDESPWLKSSGFATEIYGQGRSFRHYIFLGGDNIVEVITDSYPQVSICNESQKFTYRI